jgi:hypothetical protein
MRIEPLLWFRGPRDAGHVPGSSWLRHCLVVQPTFASSCRELPAMPCLKDGLLPGTASESIWMTRYRVTMYLLGRDDGRGPIPAEDDQ